MKLEELKQNIGDAIPEEAFTQKQKEDLIVLKEKENDINIRISIENNEPELDDSVSFQNEIKHP